MYPQHQFQPEDLLHFVEMTGFSQEWKSLGLDDENDLSGLQILIMMNPKEAPVIRGTGGLRKMRFAPIGSDVGKRGGYRVCYVYFEPYGLVLLVTIYGKGQSENLSHSQRNAIKNELIRTRRYLDTDHYK